MHEGVNPKDSLGSKKISFTKFPTAGLIQGTRAMMDGARKYGAFNWRDEPVQAHIYVDAAIRHLLAWFSGEENSADAGVHHLGHAMACCAIIIDAQENNCLADDRHGADTVVEMLDRYTVKDAPVPEIEEDGGCPECDSFSPLAEQALAILRAEGFDTSGMGGPPPRDARATEYSDAGSL